MVWRDDQITHARDEARHLEANDEMWLVYEVGPSFDRRGPSLVFESPALIRRVRNYPRNWRSMADAELVVLMEAL